LDDPRRFPTVASVDIEPCRVVYTGSLGLRRYEAVQDLLAVVRTMNGHQKAIQIHIYSSGIPRDTPRELLESPEIEFLPLPTHDELPSILASASVLFLPESFCVPPEMIELAISSKVHLYMMSGRPILVYGPAYSGTVGYALEGGWAAVVTERNRDALKTALRKLLDDNHGNDELMRNARARVGSHHDSVSGRARFLSALADAFPKWHATGG
jgi:glycosyltransferase involved in cell wall biosynthesis